MKRAAKWLLPTYWIFRVVTPRWIRHDCKKQPVLCRLEFVTGWDWGSGWGDE